MVSAKISRWAYVVAVNVAAILLVLGLAEGAVRLLAVDDRADQDDQLPMCRPDPLTIWRYRPDTQLAYRAPEFEMRIRTNGDGLRSAPLPAGDAPTILFIGDSFTFGWGVSEEQRYSEVLARLLGDMPDGVRVRVVNAGHWMFTFDQQLLLARQLVDKYRPTVVVQGFYWMHVRSLFNHRLERGPDGTLEAVHDSKIQVSERGIVKLRSDLLERPPFGSQLVAVAARTILNRDLRERAADWVDYMRPGSTRDEALWSLTDQLVGETVRSLQQARVAYVPFLIPASIEVSDVGWPQVGWKGAAPPPGVDVGLPASRMAAMFARRGLKVVELAAPMRAQGGSALYFPQDGHWNAEGHRVVGALLAAPVRRALAPAGP